jgi:hypothetical protein
MRLFEFVSSNGQMLDIIRDLLVRAKAEGADSVSLEQLANEFNGEVDVDMIRTVLSNNRQSFKGLVGNITDTDVEFEKPQLVKNKEKSDQAMTKTAVATALKGLKQ